MTLVDLWLPVLMGTNPRDPEATHKKFCSLQNALLEGDPMEKCREVEDNVCATQILYPWIRNLVNLDRKSCQRWEENPKIFQMSQSGYHLIVPSWGPQSQKGTTVIPFWKVRLPETERLSLLLTLNCGQCVSQFRHLEQLPLLSWTIAGVLKAKVMIVPTLKG